MMKHTVFSLSHRHTHTHTLTHICTHTHTYAHTHKHTHICTHTHTYAHTHTHTHSHSHAHTPHTDKPRCAIGYTNEPADSADTGYTATHTTNHGACLHTHTHTPPPSPHSLPAHLVFALRGGPGAPVPPSRGLVSSTLISYSVSGSRWPILCVAFSTGCRSYMLPLRVRYSTSRFTMG